MENDRLLDLAIFSTIFQKSEVTVCFSILHRNREILFEEF